jgi:hypothetical protein
MYTFKSKIVVLLVRRTPPEDLVFCDVCGGINTRARAASKIDCTACGGTGYQNLYTPVPVSAAFIPGPQKRWNATTGGLDYFGECTIKLDASLEPILSEVEYIEWDGVKWAFNVVRRLGEALGQPRLMVALTRK